MADLAREIGFTQISVSHEVSPLMKYVGRGDTTVVDAYLSPILRRYVAQVASELPAGARLMFMQSNGGLADAARFQGKDSILSGPAGGVVGAVETARQAGLAKIIGFDMGGTSTDVSHYDGNFERAFETQVAGVRMRAPMMRIHTVAAGGGSILHYDGARFRAGPDSAGANPGPACYRRGGPLTVTDCNVMLGRIQADFFPHVFGPKADQPIDAATVREKFQALAGELGKGRSAEQIAEGFLTVAVENMANAIKEISIERGHDVTQYALCCFGGAGGQHACRVADALGMTTVFLHPLAGVLSAYGMGLADVRVLRELAVEATLAAELLPELQAGLDRLAGEAERELEAQGVAEGDRDAHKRLHLRYAGTDTALVVPMGSIGELQAAFEATHRQRYGFVVPGKSLIVEAALGRAGGQDREAGGDPSGAAALGQTGAQGRGGLLHRRRVAEDPALSARGYGGGRAHRGSGDHRRAHRHHRAGAGLGGGDGRARPSPAAPPSGAPAQGRGRHRCRSGHAGGVQQSLHVDRRADGLDPGEHQPFREHQGAPRFLLRPLRPPGPSDRQRPAYAGPSGLHGGERGDHHPLAAQQHGAGRCLRPQRALQRRHASARHHRGDAGLRRGERRDLLLYGQPRPSCRYRRHHPGLHAARSRTVEEEGVLIDDFLLVEGGRFREAEMRALLTSGAHPARNPDQNIADLAAQVAANAKGVEELRRMTRDFGRDVVHAYMDHVQDNAEEQVRRVLDRLKDGRFVYEMDDGSQIAVAVTIDAKSRSARVDFTGTSDQLASNFNAPSAVCRAAVLYVFRTLVEDDIPMNEGCLKPLEIVIPPARC